jgi:hypothetical protein
MRSQILRTMTFVLFVVLGNNLASTSMQASGVARDHVWKSYTNVLFRYAICYPEDLMFPQGESANSDGQTFLAKDGALLLVFGQNNALGQSLEDAMVITESRLTGSSGKITYKALRRDWFVVSGQAGSDIFYAKTRYRHDQFTSFELTYNYSAAAVYEPLIARLNACFADVP